MLIILFWWCFCSSGNNVPAYYPALFASFIEKAGSVDRFFAGPSSGGGKQISILIALYLFNCWLCITSIAAPAAAGAPAAAAAPAAKAPEKPKEEEVDALDGGMDMFGGGGGGKGDY